MKRITLHHDGHGRMERLLVLATDEPATEPPGNSSHHRYELFSCDSIESADRAAEIILQDLPEPTPVRVADVQFQRGPFDHPESTPGVLATAVVAVLIDHLQGFQTGGLATRENALAITKLQEALFWLRERADERARRGVLGTMVK